MLVLVGGPGMGFRRQGNSTGVFLSLFFLQSTVRNDDDVRLTGNSNASLYLEDKCNKESVTANI